MIWGLCFCLELVNDILHVIVSMLDTLLFAIIVKPTYITQLHCCAPNCITLCLNFSWLFAVYMYCSVPRRDKFAGWNLQSVHFYAVAMDILNLNTGILSKFHFLQHFSEILQCSSGCSSSVIFAPPDTLTWLILDMCLKCIIRTSTLTIKIFCLFRTA